MTACCWVRTKDEINRPIPMIDNKNTIMDPKRAGMSPRIGTPSRNTLKTSITTELPTAIISAGIVFPIRISSGVRGETSSCSNVPNSRSLAMDSADTMNPTIDASTANSAGVADQSGVAFALNQVRDTMVVGATTPAASSRSIL